MMAIRTTDELLVREILENPTIKEAICEDGCDGINIDVVGEAWVLIIVDDDVIGTYNLHPHNSITCEIHAHILPEFRKQYSMESGKCILKWLLEFAPMYKKLIAQVPECHQNVVNFCLAQGFKQEGVNRLSYQKNGKIINQVMLGMTKQEIEAAVNE